MSGQLPPKVDNTHRHYADQLVDRDEDTLIDTKAEIEAAKTLPTPGGEQTFRLLGPFTINFDDTDLTEWGETLPRFGPVLDAGTIVLRAWVIPTAFWSGTGDAILEISIAGTGATDVNDTGQTLVSMRMRNAGSPMVQSGPILWLPSKSPYWDGSLEGEEVTVGGALLTIPAQMYAFADAASTAGTADVYALIAEPAAG